MGPKKFDLLLTKFNTQKNEIENYLKNDTDFRNLCNDYEELGQTIAYLKNLTKVPISQIKKQIESQQELFEELEKEIRLFIENDNH